MKYDIGFRDKQMSDGGFMRVYFADLPGGGNIERVGEVGFWQVVVAILLSCIRLNLESAMSREREQEWKEFFDFNFGYLTSEERSKEFLLSFDGMTLLEGHSISLEGTRKEVVEADYHSAAITTEFP